MMAALIEHYAPVLAVFGYILAVAGLAWLVTRRDGL